MFTKELTEGFKNAKGNLRFKKKYKFLLSGGFKEGLRGALSNRIGTQEGTPHIADCRQSPLLKFSRENTKNWISSRFSL